MGLVSKGIQILREEGPVSLGKKGSRFARNQTYKIGSGREVLYVALLDENS